MSACSVRTQDDRGQPRIRRQSRPRRRARSLYNAIWARRNSRVAPGDEERGALPLCRSRFYPCAVRGERRRSPSTQASTTGAGSDSGPNRALHPVIAARLAHFRFLGGRHAGQQGKAFVAADHQRPDGAGRQRRDRVGDGAADEVRPPRHHRRDGFGAAGEGEGAARVDGQAARHEELADPEIEDGRRAGGGEGQAAGGFAQRADADRRGFCHGASVRTHTTKGVS